MLSIIVAMCGLLLQDATASTTNNVMLALGNVLVHRWLLGDSVLNVNQTHLVIPLPYMAVHLACVMSQALHYAILLVGSVSVNHSMLEPRVIGV